MWGFWFSDVCFVFFHTLAWWSSYSNMFLNLTRGLTVFETQTGKTKQKQPSVSRCSHDLFYTKEKWSHNSTDHISSQGSVWQLLENRQKRASVSHSSVLHHLLYSHFPNRPAAWLRRALNTRSIQHINHINYIWQSPAALPGTWCIPGAPLQCWAPSAHQQRCCQLPDQPGSPSGGRTGPEKQPCLHETSNQSVCSASRCFPILTLNIN